ncbi:MAG TPA: hypothetical protein VF789_01250 [Thermoanaerobaculia bacterium]
MSRFWRSLAFAALALAVAAAPSLAQPITVAPGNDGWVTPANSSQIDLGVFPINAFFGPGSVVTPQIVSLSGAPLAPGLGSIDTLLVRNPPPVTFNLIPETKTFPVEIKALRLRGNVNINGTNFQLTVALSSTPSGPGTITATRLTPDGGRFNSSFPVLPKLVFIEVGNPGNRVDIDCAVAACPSPLILGANNVCWEVAFGPNGFNPATKGITPIAAGIGVDGDFDGVNDYVTVGRKQAGWPGLEFHQGYDPTPPWPLCGGTGESSHDHAVYSLTHKVRPPRDCATQTGTGTLGSDTDVAGGKATAIDANGTAVTATPSRLCTYQTTTATELQPNTDTTLTTGKKQPAGGKKAPGKPVQDNQQQ